MTVINGKKGKVKITAEGSVEVNDTSANTTYVVSNKKSTKYGENQFAFGKGSGTDTIKGYDGNDSISFYDDTDLAYSKSGASNDLVITKNGGKDKITLKDYFKLNSSERISGIDLSSETISVSGSGKIYGTEYSDVIKGGKKADKITTGYGADVIESGKGNDTITITGEGDKTFIFNKGDGNNTIAVAVDEDGDPINIDDVILNFVGSGDEEIKYTYKRTFNDLTITATHTDNKSESVTLKNYFYFISGDDFEDVYIDTEDVDDMLKDGSVTVSPVKVSKILSDYGVDKELKSVGIKLPSAIKNVNVHVGTTYDDVFTGTTGKDIMLSMSGEENSFTTGKKGQTVIASMGDYSNDEYTVNSFTAGSVVFDKGGEDNITIKGVDVNNIHMIGKLGFELDNVSMPIFKSEVDLKGSAVYFTDSKGVSNFAGIDYSGIYKKVATLFDDSEKSEKQIVKTANSLISTASGLIDKFRGTAIIAAKDKDDDSDLKPIEKVASVGKISTLSEGKDEIGELGETEEAEETVLSNILENITVVDSKGNEQKISYDSIEAYTSIMQNKLNEYLGKMNNLYESHLEKLYGEDTPDLTNIKGFAQYLLTAPGMTGYTSADKKIYNSIKSGFFNLFQNMYIGTDGDNSYTIKKAEYGAQIVSGTGSDKFTFSGDIAMKPDWENYGYPPTYQIVSELNEGDKDTIRFTGYTLDEMNMYNSVYRPDEDTVMFDGIYFHMGNYTTQKFAEIDYNVGYDVTDKMVELNLQDKKRTYNYTVEHNSNSISYDWSNDKDNHYAITAAKETNILSNKGYNTIISNVLYEDDYSLNYTYGGGVDVVTSNGSSTDTYNVEFDKNTQLVIDDQGAYDNDTLAITGDNLRLFFNIAQESYDTYTNVIMTSNNLNKSGFNLTTEKYDEYTKYYATAKKGITFNNIENVTINDTELDIDSAISQIVSDVQGWLGSHTKYEDVAEVLNRGTKSEIAEVLAYYSNVNLNDYTIS